MDISLFQQLLATLDAELQQIRRIDKDPAKWAGKSIDALRPFLVYLKDHLGTYPIERQSEKAQFYREVKLPLMSKVIFYTAVSRLWAGRCMESDVQKQRQYWKDKLSRTRRFFEDQSICCSYIGAADAFPAGADYRAAKLLGYGMVEAFIQQQLFCRKKVTYF